MINILKQELIKMKELQEWKYFLLPVFQEFELSVRKSSQRGEKIGVERRKFELTEDFIRDC